MKLMNAILALGLLTVGAVCLLNLNANAQQSATQQTLYNNGGPTTIIPREVLKDLNTWSDIRQWNYGVEIRKKIDGADVWLVIRGFPVTGEDTEWLTDGYTIAPESATLTLNGSMYEIDKAGGLLILKVPLWQLQGDIAVKAFGGGKTVFELTLDNFFVY